MTSKRKFYKNGVQHIFQITVDRGLLFYTDVDCIVFFTILCYAAVKYRVRITACCIMLNHFHIQARFRTAEDMELFVNELTSIFALMYNRRYHRKGQLFKKSYGSSPKRHEADIDDNFIYICNNPIPKSAVEKAVDYRWSFIAYMDSDHPFSRALDKTGMSEELRRSMSIIEKRHSEGKYLSYKIFDKAFASLTAEERAQIVDYTISVYNVIDYSRTKSKWGTYEKLAEVLALLKGSEYDVEEDYSMEDYRHYYQMNEIAMSCGYDPYRFRFDTDRLSASDKMSLQRAFLISTQASATEIDKYLHLSRRVTPKHPNPAAKLPQGTLESHLPCG